MSNVHHSKMPQSQRPSKQISRSVNLFSPPSVANYVQQETFPFPLLFHLSYTSSPTPSLGFFSKNSF